MKAGAATALVVGGQGWIGNPLAATLARGGFTVRTTTRRTPDVGPTCAFVDLAQDVSVWRPPWPVDVAFLGGAVTSLERCRTDPDGTRAVNVDQTVALARTLIDSGAFVIFPSTNLVFDGARPAPGEDQPRSPTTAYGRQKAEAEARLLELGGDRVAVVRLTKVLGPGLPLFQGWLQALRAGRAVTAFDDLTMAPVSLPFVLDVVGRVAEGRRGGVWQLSASRQVSYAAAARHLAARVGAAPALVQATTSRQAGVVLESVPAHTTLNTERLNRDLKLPAPEPLLAVEAVLM